MEKKYDSKFNFGSERQNYNHAKQTYEMFCDVYNFIEYWQNRDPNITIDKLLVEISSWYTTFTPWFPFWEHHLGNDEINKINQEYNNILVKQIQCDDETFTAEKLGETRKQRGIKVSKQDFERRMKKRENRMNGTVEAPKARAEE